MKRWYLFLIVIVIFIATFYKINLNYDRFYRVNGINNDNRVIIEKYLSKEDQNFLVENQISITKLIDYMSVDHFNIRNYQYYNLLIDTKRYTNKNILISTGNALKEKLTKKISSNAFSLASSLINNNLEAGYLNDDSFNFDYLNIYIALKPLYSDLRYIEDTKQYVEELTDEKMNMKQIEDMLQTAVSDYNRGSLKTLIMNAGISRRIIHPSSVTAVVDENSYIGSYEPARLVLIENIHRMKYVMYLENNSYYALASLYKAMGNLSKTLVVRKAYISYNYLPASQQGHSEYQLGNTVEFTDSSYNYKDFSDSETSRWLEAHAHEYGYILRYPPNKASSTNKSHDAHVYRYVGKKAAKEIHDSQSTLNDYVLKKIED